MPDAEKDAALRSDLAEVIYRELGDMVNRDYLIDALMPVVLTYVTPPTARHEPECAAYRANGSRLCRCILPPALADARRRPAMREDDFTNTPEDAAAYELLRGRDEYLGEHAQPIVKPFCSVCQGGVLGYVCGPCARDADFDWRGEQLRSWAL